MNREKSVYMLLKFLSRATLRQMLTVPYVVQKKPSLEARVFDPRWPPLEVWSAETKSAPWRQPPLCCVLS